MDRTQFIGGSDIAAVMGLSRWKTPLHLWAEKTGEVEQPDLSDNEAVEMGIELEETVARVFTKRTGLKVRKAPKNYIYKDHDYMRCQIDRLVEGTNELLECKTASAWKAKEWEGEGIPEEYILQLMWQLGITGRKVGHIAVLIGGQKFKYKKIEFDLELFNNMVEQAVIFWKMVQDKTPPTAMGNDNQFIVQLYPESDEAFQQVEELNDRVALRQQIKGNIDELNKQLNEIEASIKQVIGDNLGIETGEYTVTWKAQTTNRLDTKLIREEQPEIYNQYVVPSQTRVLRVKKSK